VSGGARAEDEPKEPQAVPASIEHPAGDPGPGAGAKQAPLPDDAVLAVLTGDDVNVRVGPRRDNHPLTQLRRGDVVIVLERIGDWAGVRIPAGFPAVVAARYAEPVGEHAVRITASKLNLRVGPPEQGKPAPATLRDRVHRGDLLPLLRKEGEWYWIVAPEGTRAYVFRRYLKELGPAKEHAALLKQARGVRDELLRSMIERRRRLRVMRASRILRAAIGRAQKELERRRAEGGHDRLPVMHIADTLAGVVAKQPEADPHAKKIAATLLADLEAEIELRVARKDAELARLRGLAPAAPAPLTPKQDTVELRGIVRWEAAPKWRNGGAFILWIEDEPAYVLRLTTGTPRPLPDLKGSCDGKPRAIHGRQPGDRVFGLPAIDVVSIGA